MYRVKIRCEVFHIAGPKSDLLFSSDYHHNSTDVRLIVGKASFQKERAWTKVLPQA